METENTPNTIQFITLDDLFDAFATMNSWLKNSIKQFVEDEDADFVSETPEWLNDGYLEQNDEHVYLRGITSGYGDRLKISFSGFGFRRGVLLMNSMYLDFPHPEEDLSSNWYFGFTVAGNGTPAYIFPVNDNVSRHLAKEVLKRVIL